MASHTVTVAETRITKGAIKGNLDGKLLHKIHQNHANVNKRQSATAWKWEAAEEEIAVAAVVEREEDHGWGENSNKKWRGETMSWVLYSTG